MKEDRELKIKELIKFLKLTVEQLKTEIPRLNKGCCGYLAYKIANLLIENEFYSFTFGTITPLWSKTGLKSFEHIYLRNQLKTFPQLLNQLFYQSMRLAQGP